jgi:predicted nucleotidyltransferase
MRSESFGSVTIFWPRYSREELLARLREGVAALARELPVRRALLVGSWARGRQTAASDVDVLVVYEGPPRPDAYRLCRTVIDVVGLEPHAYAQEEAAALGLTLDRMARDGVDLMASPTGRVDSESHRC